MTDPEPLPPDHPLWDAPGVLITPHLAGDTARGGAARVCVRRRAGTRYVEGEPLENVVEGGY